MPPSALDPLLGEPRSVEGHRLETTKDLICMNARGLSGAPYATRERPHAGFDTAESGGSYRSFHSMQLHRTRHVRTVHGPNERFQKALAPPTSSFDYGFGKQQLKPPAHPISSTWISRSASEIAKTVGKNKR